MARARNIKPGFFKNELLAEISTAGRLFFEGLWCIADREGRLEDRPRRLWAEVMPYDPYEGDEVMAQLAERGFVVRYEVAGVRYVQIINFLKHQTPHCKEKPSVIPGIPRAATEEAPDMHGTSTVQAPGKPNECTEHAPSRFPDSLIPGEELSNPDGLLVASDAADDAGQPAKVLDKTRPPLCPHQQIIDLYHEILPANPRIRSWTDARAAHLRARWNEDPKRQDLDWWRRFFGRIAEACPFLTGQKSGREGRPFTPGLEWIAKAENFTKILEGRYVEEAA